MTTKSKWYSIRKRTAIAAAALGIAASASAEVYIYGDIGESWWGDSVTAAEFVKEINELDVSQLTVRINSYGGAVVDGIAIHNAIKRHKATVTTCIDGLAASIASLIAMAGDTVEMADNAMLMIHAPWGGTYGNAVEMRRYADMLDTWSEAMAGSYAVKSGKDRKDVLALLQDGEDHWYTSAEALAEGFVDNVTDSMPVLAMASVAGASARYHDIPAAWLKASGLQPAGASAPAPAAAPAAALPAAAAAKTNAAAAAHTQESPMPAPVEPGGAPSVDVKAILAADRARQDGIAAAFKPHLAVAGTPELLATLQRDDSVTVEAAGSRLLAHLGSLTQPVAGGGNVRTVEDARDKARNAFEQSILARAGVVLEKGKGAVRVDASNPYRGAKLLDIARACLVQAGVRVEGMDQMQIVGAAFTQSTSDFPILLGNVMHKALQAAYAIQADTWSLFCARGSVSDFRAHNRYRVGSLSNFDALNELGEFKNKPIPDGEKESITATTKGNIINISRQIVINDDMGAFMGLATAFGRAGKRTIEADVYASLALNAGMGPTLSDGVSLFHASHNNVSTGAPTVDNFDAARVVMSNQRDVGGNDYLALTPDVWLGPESLKGNALVVVNSAYDPDTANKLQRYNKSANLVREVVGTPRLTSTPWYFFADPLQAPVMEVAFLDGNDTPYLEMQNGFDQDGVRWKARLDFAVGGRDYRGAVRSTGA